MLVILLFGDELLFRVNKDGSFGELKYKLFLIEILFVCLELLDENSVLIVEFEKWDVDICYNFV